jgi:hypothetical protein
MPCATVTTRVEVEVDLDEALEELDESDIDALFRRHLSKKGAEVPLGLGTGDPSRETLVERAYLAAKRLPKVPRELADLFWHVHGRAL